VLSVKSISSVPKKSINTPPATPAKVGCPDG